MSYLSSELLAEESQTHRGPARKFGPFHFYMALREIASSGRIGRARISKALGIGEGSVRTLLDLMEEKSLVKRNNAGIVLTDSGKALMERFPIRITRVGKCELSVGKYSSLALVRAGGRRIGNGIAQRDAAIKNGGDGAITMVVRNGKLLLPPDFTYVTDTTINIAAFTTLGATDGDGAIIGSGPTRVDSEKAAYHAALTLL